MDDLITEQSLKDHEYKAETLFYGLRDENGDFEDEDDIRIFVKGDIALVYYFAEWYAIQRDRLSFENGFQVNYATKVKTFTQLNSIIF